MNPADFRREVRTWLAEMCPPGVRGPGPVPYGSRSLPMSADSALWLERMADKGWTVPTWPAEYGGAGLSREAYQILVEELVRIAARPPLTGRGVNYIGPTLLEFGTREQKARWLPKIARGDGGWAMGYSEPGAGSDLAGLSLRAELVGDHYLLNGRKTWTSDAVHCDYIFVLARTSPEKPKHEGISLLLVDMQQPGVEARPIRLISGASPFCETLFENALAARNDLIGGEGKGWSVGKRLLQFERSTHAGINISGSQGGMEQTPQTARLLRKILFSEQGTGQDPDLRRRFLRYSMNIHTQRITQKRALAELDSRAPGFTSSVVKLTQALFTQEGDELLMAALGMSGFRTEGDAADEEIIQATRQWLYQKSLTIAGGTKEVQKNIIAKRVLGLPD